MVPTTNLIAVQPFAAPGEPSALDAMLQLDHPTKMAACEWANAELPTPAQIGPGGVLDRASWHKAGQYGLLGIHVPVEHGGSAADAVSIALMFEGLGLSHADNGVVFAITSHALTAARAICTSGTPEQLDRWAPGLANGDLIAAFAMSEPEAGSHPWDLETSAAEQADGSWILNGRKAWATLGPICDVALVFASTTPGGGQWGISAFIVDANAQGFARGAAVEKMGMNACPFGELVFQDCRLPPEALLGRVGAGAAIFSSVVEAERAYLYASQIGAGERMIDQSVDYARRRRQGGAHVGSHQAVAHRIVDMKLSHEAARLLLYKTAARDAQGDSLSLEAALTKLMAAETAVQSSIDAMRTFGALGYTTQIGLEAELRDALGGLSYSATPDVTRNIVASLMGLTRPLS